MGEINSDLTPVGMIFFMIGLFIACHFTSKKKKVGLIIILLYLWHSFFSLFYASFSLLSPVPIDAMQYYTAKDAEIGMGTKLIEFLTIGVRDIFHASYFDTFLLYQISGFLGLCLFLDIAMNLLGTKFTGKTRRIVTTILFLPGINYWTVGIGKDGLIFLGIVGALWSIYFLPEKPLSLLMSLILIFLIRPHIGIIMILSGLITIATTSKNSLAKRFFLVALILAVLTFTLPTALEFTGLESVDSKTVDGYIQERQGYNQSGEGAVDISQIPFVLQILTYLYRPLFFDVSNFMGVIASVENLWFVLLSRFVLTSQFSAMIFSHSNNWFFRFNLIYFLAGTSLLATTTSNLGIALRQKYMVLPSLMLLLIFAYSMHQARINGNVTVIQEVR